MFESDLGGPYDGALVFDIIHHLSGEQIVALLRRVREALKPGGTLAVLDMFRCDAKRQRASAAAVGLLFHLTSGADLHGPAELAGYREAGFGAPKRTKVRRIPDQDLYQAHGACCSPRAARRGRRAPSEQRRRARRRRGARGRTAAAGRCRRTSVAAPHEHGDERRPRAARRASASRARSSRRRAAGQRRARRAGAGAPPALGRRLAHPHRRDHAQVVAERDHRADHDHDAEPRVVAVDGARRSGRTCR